MTQWTVAWAGLFSAWGRLQQTDRIHRQAITQFGASIPHWLHCVHWDSTGRKVCEPRTLPSANCALPVCNRLNQEIMDAVHDVCHRRLRPRSTLKPNPYSIAGARRISPRRTGQRQDQSHAIRDNHPVLQLVPSPKPPRPFGAYY